MITILLATDGSPSSRHAAAYVAEYVAGLPGVTAVMVTVAVTQEGIPQAEMVLAATTEAMEPVPLGLTTRVLVHADQVRAVADYAATRDAQMIIVGRRGQSALKSLLLGSFSQRIIEIAHCPVLVVK